MPETSAQASLAGLAPPTIAGRKILVFGASSGIGAAIARMAGARGASVAFSARRAERLEDLATDIPSGAALPGDVCDESAVHRVVAEAVAQFGGLDAVVYATGISPLLPMREAHQADWRAVLDTNLIGAALVSTAVAPHLIASRGRLVILSSKSTRQPFPDLALYTTSKIALDGLIRCLPLEFPGLLVSRVVVGNTIDTGFYESWDPDAMTAAVSRWAEAGVLGTGATDAMSPADVAETILHVICASAHIDEVGVLDYDRGVPSGS